MKAQTALKIFLPIILTAILAVSIPNFISALSLYLDQHDNDSSWYPTLSQKVAVFVYPVPERNEDYHSAIGIAYSTCFSNNFGEGFDDTPSSQLILNSLNRWLVYYKCIGIKVKENTILLQENPNALKRPKPVSKGEYSNEHNKELEYTDVNLFAGKFYLSSELGDSKNSFLQYIIAYPPVSSNDINKLTNSILDGLNCTDESQLLTVEIFADDKKIDSLYNFEVYASRYMPYSLPNNFTANERNCVIKTSKLRKKEGVQILFLPITRFDDYNKIVFKQTNDLEVQELNDLPLR
jgi:hypothetical protein